MKNRIEGLFRRATQARFVHLVVLSRVIVGALLLSGCVSATSLEQANSATDVQSEGRRRASVELESAQAEIARLRAERDQLAEWLQAEESSMATARLDIVTSQKERDQQAELVSQLSSDLARAGEVLKAATLEQEELLRQKAELEAAKAEAAPAAEAPVVEAAEAPAAADVAGDAAEVSP